jgi:hypothetical protein
MDFSSSINFDEIDERVVIKPRVSIKKNHLKLGLSLNSYEKDRSKSFYIGQSPQNSPLIQVPVLSKGFRNSNPRNGIKPMTGFFAFEGQKVMLSSLKDLVNFDENSQKASCLGAKNFRRFKWNHGKLRSKSCWGNESFVFQENLNIKSEKKKNVKRVFVPRTRINVNAGQGKKPELRISGVMKDFVFKDFSKFKDSANLTDE